MQQTFYINQVIAMLESDAVDWDDEKTVRSLKRLHDLKTVRSLKRLHDLLDKALKSIGV